MTNTRYRPLLFWYAVLTVIVALLAIVVGALVTTKNAGMAFRDWPTSDGHNLFLYPWLKSTGDEFLEHGHRLAGSLIGLVSIGLVVVAFKFESRRWVKVLALSVLGCVICQGILGGTRVLWDEKVLAMIHGSFGSLVLSLMATVALFTGRSWFRVSEEKPQAKRSLKLFRFFATLLPVFVMTQYVLGGLLRHLGMGLLEHVGGAGVVLLLTLITFFLAQRSGLSWLKRPAWLMLGVVLLQITIGLAAFVTKFGFPPTGYVAVQYSIHQIVFRTLHTVVGMFVLMNAILLAIRVNRAATWQEPVTVTESATKSVPVTEAKANSALVSVSLAKGGVQ